MNPLNKVLLNLNRKKKKKNLDNRNLNPKQQNHLEPFRFNKQQQNKKRILSNNVYRQLKIA
jgi:hypothetical protein